MSDSIIQVFISHAGPDWRQAKRLAADLRAAGNNITVDLDDLKIGDDVVHFMNDAIQTADFVIILHSQHTAHAINQTAELNAAIWNELNQSGAVCLNVCLDDTELPPLLGTKLFVKLDHGNEESYATALKKLVERIGQAEHPTKTVSKAFSASGANPFRRTRAEYFEEDIELLARTFAPPDQRRLNKLEDLAPCILEGPRGTGKSMLLMSLRARNRLTQQRNGVTVKIFGSYLKLTRGALTNVVDVGQSGGDIAALLKETSSQELFACIYESIVSEVQYCIQNNLLSCSGNDLKALSLDLSRLIAIDECESIEEVLRALTRLRQSIAGYLRRRIVYGEQVNVPTVVFDIDILGKAIELLKKNVREIRDHRFLILLDEYENLFEFQQEIVNGIAKISTPNFSIKIARKRSAAYPSSTPLGQELQETHDYSRINLVYDLSNSHQRKAFLTLLRRFVINLIREELQQNISLNELLPKFSAREVSEERWLDAVCELIKVDRNEFDTWPKNRQREKLTYYGVAATYRCLRGRQKKRFSGQDELALVSSGIIRYFQEILAIAYYLWEESTGKDTKLDAISPEFQNKAVHLVSAHNLTSLSRNVQGYGESLRYFLLDLGGCLRHKLLRHRSEPEAARITIKDPVYLTDQSMTELKAVLDAGVREGVFEIPDGLPGFLPRHLNESQPIEYVICRMYAPVLGISPRARWRTETTCSELRDLLVRGGRVQAIRTIKSRWVREMNDKQDVLFDVQSIQDG